MRSVIYTPKKAVHKPLKGLFWCERWDFPRPNATVRVVSAVSRSHWSRQTGHFLSAASLYPPQAALQRQTTGTLLPKILRLRLAFLEADFKSHRERQKKRHPKGCLFFWCERWDLNPHVHSNTSTSSLPVCRFQHARKFPGGNT